MMRKLLSNIFVQKFFMYKILLLLFSGFWIVSCDSDIDSGSFVVGSDYLSISNKVILIDTLTVDLATIKFDSITTSSQSRILVGNYDDPIFGKVTASSFFQLAGESYELYNYSSDIESANYVFDSIKMILIKDKYYYGDTTKVKTLSIHKLLQNVKANVEDSKFYNSSSLSYDGTSLGTVTYSPKPNTVDTLKVKLSTEFGSGLFDKIKSREVSNYDEFVNYFKGLVIRTSSTTSSSVEGYSLSSTLRMYYSKKVTGESSSSLYLDFNVYDGSKQFNRITLDRTGTVLSDLPVSTSKQSSALMGNKGYIQSGAGIACRIDFPNIKQLKNFATTGAIVDAELLIKPVANSYSKEYPLKDSLQVYIGDNLNRISGALYNASGSQVYAILNTSSDEFNENISYKIPLGSFLQKEMLKTSDSQSTLILALPNNSKTVNRLVLGDQKNADNKLKLKIYYISY